MSTKEPRGRARKSTAKSRKSKSRSKSRPRDKASAATIRGKDKVEPKGRATGKGKGGKGTAKGRKSTTKGSKFVIPKPLLNSFLRSGPLWYWKQHPFETKYVGLLPEVSAKGARPRWDEYQQALKEKRTPAIIENARRLAEREAKNARTTEVGQQTSGWKTETPVRGSERDKLATAFPGAFLIYEEKQDKAGNIYWAPLFPIVARSALRTGDFRPDRRGLEAALRRFMQHWDKYRDTVLDERIAGIKRRQKA